jgi:hypothetical protein
MSKPQYRTPEYRAAVRSYKRRQQAGEWLVCVEAICLHPSRDIAPDQAVDVAHDTSGTVILGPSHMRCNRSEGATRGNRMRAGVGRWVL